MIVLDANVLLYAHNQAAPQHTPVVHWLKEIFLKEEAIGLPWVTAWAFLRIRTNQRLWPKPESPAAALSILHYWFSQPGVVLLNPGPRHGELLERLMEKHQVAGPLVTDAVLAALAMEHGATLASTDQDFSRFTDLRWVNPLAVQ
jgi:toxin-antitoxin system PIN domain toxin